MTQEEKQLLLQDLSARLPYGVKVEIISYGQETLKPWFGKLSCKDLDCFIHDIAYESIKPYLRPMSSMTEEEKQILELCNAFVELRSIELKVDFYNQHHLDYRGLIERGLAIEAPKGMYK